MAALGIKFS